MLVHLVQSQLIIVFLLFRHQIKLFKSSLIHIYILANIRNYLKVGKVTAIINVLSFIVTHFFKIWYVCVFFCLMYKFDTVGWLGLDANEKIYRRGYIHSKYAESSVTGPETRTPAGGPRYFLTRANRFTVGCLYCTVCTVSVGSMGMILINYTI